MVKRPAPRRPPTRLYVATPAASDPTALAVQLSDVLAQIDVAAVLLRLAESDPRTMISSVKTVAAAVQANGTALLLDGHEGLVARGGADGAHCAGIDALQEALASLKPDRIAGVGRLTTRHDAMLAGEAGADYVLFGEPDRQGHRPSVEAIADRLNWWAELFEPPCVGFAASIDDASVFTAAGADFILVGDWIWRDPRGARLALMDVEQAIRQSPAATHPQTKAEAE